MILATVAGIGILLIMLGAVHATDRKDHYTKPKPRPAAATIPRQTKPFIHSDTQCRRCGLDGELLTIDTRICWVCHERTT